MKKIPLYILIALNLLTVAAMLITAFQGRMSPERFGLLSVTGHAFPLFLLLTVAFMAVWVFIKKRFIIISSLGLIAAYAPVTLYCPINTANEKPAKDTTMLVMSYNTCGWGHGKAMPGRKYTNAELREYIDSVDADIVSLQESYVGKTMKKLLQRKYEYVDTAKFIEGTLTLLSRYPILKKELVVNHKGSGAAAFWTLIGSREVIIINAHLISVGISMNERRNFSSIMHGEEDNSDTVRATSLSISRKIIIRNTQRAREAEQVAQFIRLHKGTPIIVTGDFNDHPLSYTHHTISQGLTDCYEATAFGPGYTFRHFSIRSRIDNILCTKDIEPYYCHVDDTVRLSDHQPMMCYFRKL